MINFFMSRGKKSELEEAVEFTTNILKETYIPRPYSDSSQEYAIKRDKEHLEYIKSFDGKKYSERTKKLKKLIKTWRTEIREFMQEKMDEGMDINHANIAYHENELENMIKNYDEGKATWEEFESKHLNVVTYIVKLGLGENPRVISNEEIVYDTLSRLNGNTLEGAMGMNGDSMNAMIFLGGLIEYAAIKHAKKIGKKPNLYVSNLKRAHNKKIITI